MTSSQITGANDGSFQETNIEWIIAKQIELLQTYLESSISQKLTDSISAIDGKISGLKTELESSINQKLTDSISAIDGKISGLKTELESSINQKLTDSISAIDGKISGLKTELESSINQKLTDSISAIDGKISGLKTELESSISQKLTDLISAIDGKIKGLKTEIDALKTSLTNISNKIDISVSSINQNTDQKTENSKTELKEDLLNSRKFLDVLLSYKLLEEASKLTSNALDSKESKQKNAEKINRWNKAVTEFGTELQDSNEKFKEEYSILHELLTLIKDSLLKLIDSSVTPDVNSKTNKDAILKILGLDSPKS